MQREGKRGKKEKTGTGVDNNKPTTTAVVYRGTQIYLDLAGAERGRAIWGNLGGGLKKIRLGHKGKIPSAS